MSESAGLEREGGRREGERREGGKGPQTDVRMGPLDTPNLEASDGARKRRT